MNAVANEIRYSLSENCHFNNKTHRVEVDRRVGHLWEDWIEPGSLIRHTSRLARIVSRIPGIQSAYADDYAIEFCLGSKLFDPEEIAARIAKAVKMVTH